MGIKDRLVLFVIAAVCPDTNFPSLLFDIASTPEVAAFHGWRKFFSVDKLPVKLLRMKGVLWVQNHIDVTYMAVWANKVSPGNYIQ